MTIHREKTKIIVNTRLAVNTKKRININLRLLNKIFFTLILLASFSYIASANDLTAQGFKLRDMKKQLRVMENNNQSLESKVMTLSSYNNLGEKVKNLGMVSAGKMSYIETRDGLVAKR